MTGFTEFTIEETALEWLKVLGCQRIAFGKTDENGFLSAGEFAGWSCCQNSCVVKLE